jgi:hypothetical protein
MNIKSRGESVTLGPQGPGRRYNCKDSKLGWKLISLCGETPSHRVRYVGGVRGLLGGSKLKGLPRR